MTGESSGRDNLPIEALPLELQQLLGHGIFVQAHLGHHLVSFSLNPNLLEAACFGGDKAFSVSATFS